MRHDTIDTEEAFLQETIRELTVTELEQVAGGFKIGNFVGNFNVESFNGVANTGIINNSFNLV